MAEIAFLEAIVGADITSFRRGMAEVRAEVLGTSDTLASGMQSLGSTLTMGLTVPIAILGAASLKVFSDFDAGMRNINAIMQLPEDQLAKLSKDVLEFGENTRNGATGAATALYTIVSAGFGVNDTAQAMQLLGVASKTAEAGLADENTVAQLLAQSLLAYGQNADSAAHFSDVLTQTVNLGVGSMDDVAASMGQAINIAALAGVSWDELGGSAAFLTQRGMSFANAFTSINQTISQLIKPTDALKEAFKQLGVANGTELIERYHGLGGALEALGTVSGTSADDLAKLFTNIRALRGVASILGNFDQYGNLMKSFGDDLSGVTDQAQQQQLLSFASQIDYLKSAIMGFLISIGQALAPLVGKVTEFLKGLFDQLNKLDPSVIQMAVSIGVLVAAIGPLLWIVGTLIGSAFTPLIIAIVALKQAWDTNFLGIQDAVALAIPNIQKAFNDFHLILDNVYVFVGQALFNIKDTFDKYFKGDLTSLVHDIFVGNWEQAKIDLERIWGDILIMLHDKFGMTEWGEILTHTASLVHDLLVGNWEVAQTDLTRIWKDISKLFNDHLAKPLGDALVSLGEFNFTTITLGFVVVAAAIGVMGTAIAIANIPALVVAFTALVTTGIAPFLIVGALALGLVVAWQTNFLGLRTRTEELGKTFSNTVETLKQLLFLLDYFTQGETKAKQDLESMFGMDIGRNTFPVPGQEDNPYVWAGGINSPKVPRVNLPAVTGTAAQGYNASDPTASRMQVPSVNVNVYTQDAGILIEELRRRGVDLQRYQRG